MRGRKKATQSLSDAMFSSGKQSDFEDLLGYKPYSEPDVFADTGKGILVDDELMDASLLLALGAGGLGTNHLLFGNKKKSQEETKVQQITQMKYAPYMK
tara:strand:+ start:337 stop:633 length:297 start_codon:yes stop_codon:yes gene_type:complete